MIQFSYLQHFVVVSFQKKTHAIDIILSLKNIFIYMGVMFACVPVYHIHAWCHGEHYVPLVVSLRLNKSLLTNVSPALIMYVTP